MVSELVHEVRVAPASRLSSMNTDSPASSQPIGLRGWCPATTTPTVAVTTMTATRSAAAHGEIVENVLVRADEAAMTASSATITPATITTVIRPVSRTRIAALMTATRPVRPPVRTTRRPGLPGRCPGAVRYVYSRQRLPHRLLRPTHGATLSPDRSGNVTAPQGGFPGPRDNRPGLTGPPPWRATSPSSLRSAATGAGIAVAVAFKAPANRRHPVGQPSSV